MSLPQIIFTVTNDLTYDQRMQRICTSLAKRGYHVTLVGRQHAKSAPLTPQPYRQIRLPIRAIAGKLMYISFNWKLYRWLVKEAPLDTNVAICAIDLDTIIPCYYASQKKGWRRMHDAHELFTELTEVKRRPHIAAIWSFIERSYLPRYSAGYTVNQFIADEFYKKYGIKYGVVRNMPTTTNRTKTAPSNLLPLLPNKFFFYQGAVNEGRGFAHLIAAMKQVPVPLVIAGEGNYLTQVKNLIEKENLQSHIILLGQVTPNILRLITPTAWAGITIFENSGLNQYHSLANRFFDYVQAGIPQLCIAYPEYIQLNSTYEVALMVDDLTPQTLADGLNKLLENNVLYQHLQQETLQAANQWTWENEEQQLLAIWQKLLPIDLP